MGPTISVIEGTERTSSTVFDRIDAAAIVFNLSTQFGAATIRERRRERRSARVYVYGLSVQLYKHTDCVLVLLSVVRVNIDGSEIVWRSQPRAVVRYRATCLMLAIRPENIITLLLYSLGPFI